MHRMPLLALIFMSLSFTLYGEETAADKLAAESEAYCNETAKDAAKLTPDMVIAKVDAATALVVKDGPAAFAKFKGKGCEYLFAGTYIWIHDMDGVMQMHPIKNKMEGKKLLNLKDKNGFMLFVEMNTKAKEKGAGWVEYVWPKPGEKESSPKTSYVKLAKFGEKEYVVGCGVYDWTQAKVEAALKTGK